MKFDDLEEIAFGQLRLTVDGFDDMTLRQYDNAAKGLEYSRQLMSYDIRSIAAILWNANRGKSPAKTPEQIWPLPLIDKNKGKQKSQEWKIKQIESRGYEGVDKLTDDELIWFWEKAISGTFGFDDKQVKENRKKVIEFCKQKGIGRRKRQGTNKTGE